MLRNFIFIILCIKFNAVFSEENVFSSHENGTTLLHIYAESSKKHENNFLFILYIGEFRR